MKFVVYSLFLNSLAQVAEAAKAKKRRTKIISTGSTMKGQLNPRQKLYCVCKTPYDESR